MGALTGVRIIELAETPAGEYCGKLLADFGADVVKIERPTTGSPTRQLSSVPGTSEPNEGSSLFAYLNTNKKSVTLDLSLAADLARLKELLAGAAVVIDDRGPDEAERLGLAAKQIAKDCPSLVCCLITPFGLNAPADWAAAKSLNVFHASGWGYHTPSRADPARPPLKGAGCYTADFEGGLDAAIAVLACLVRRERTGEGEFVDISQQAALLSRIDSVLGLFLAGEDTPSRSRHAYDRPSPDASYACADGYVYLFMTSRAHWRGLCTLMGNPDWAKEYDDDWLEFGVTDERVATLRHHFAEWVADKPKLETSEAAQNLGTPLVPLNNAADLPPSPQFQHRGFFQSLKHPVLGEALYPTVPYLLSETPARLVHAAPLLGQHTAEVLREGRNPVSDLDRIHATPRPNLPPPARYRGGPLAGVRVVELTKVWAGPYAGKLLAFLGAEVIKIESQHTLDVMRSYGGSDINNAPIFLSLNQEVLSAQFNLKTEEGVAQLKDLIAVSHVVINNLRPGAMERMGLGYEQLRKIRSDIISVSFKMYGNDGPLGYQTGFAPCFAALSGMSGLVGYEGEPPMNVNGRYGDSTAGAAVVLGTLAALVHRERLGQGQFVDVSAVEALTSMIGDSVFRCNLTGEVPGPDGNYHPDMAPHGCYPCMDERWISLAVDSDSKWQHLCGLLGADQLAADERFVSPAGRQAHRHQIDAVIAGLTSGQDAEALAQRLRAAGIGAFVSMDTVDLVRDGHLWERGDLLEVTGTHGPRPIVGPSWRMARAPVAIERGSPILGEHNSHVYRDLLGLSVGEIEELRRADVIT